MMAPRRVLILFSNYASLNLVTTDLISIILDFACFWTVYKWNYAIRTLWFLAWSQPNAFEFQPYHYMDQ